MAKFENMGFIHYDVPDEIAGLADQLRAKLRAGQALPASKSCYLIHWANEPGVKRIIEDVKFAWKKKVEDDVELGAEAKNEKIAKLARLVIHTIKADDSSADEIERMALMGMGNYVAQIGDSLKKQIAKAKEKELVELPRDLQRHYAQKLIEAEALVMAFRMSDDMEIAMEALRELVTANIGAKVAKKYLKKMVGDGQEAGVEDQEVMAFIAEAEPEEVRAKRTAAAHKAWATREANKAVPKMETAGEFVTGAAFAV